MGGVAAYASRHGYAFLDKRLFMPEVWFSEPYAERRGKCQVPEALDFQSKPQLAAAMLQAIAAEGLVPFKYVVADCLYGNRPDFLDAIEACVGITALVALRRLVVGFRPRRVGTRRIRIRGKCARSVSWWRPPLNRAR